MMNTPLPFEQAYQQFDRSAQADAVKLAERLRQEVVRRYPLEQWPTLPLSRYALGQGNNEESFCWWMEFGTPDIGSIRGGSARKHIIYRRNDGTWWFDDQRFKNEQEAWEATRSGFLQAFEKARSGEWNSIDELEGIDGAPALRTKTLYCYFPEELLPISSTAHIVHFLQLFGVTDIRPSSGEVVRLNRLLLARMRQCPEFAGWTGKELERFLYFWSDPCEQRAIVKITPGLDAEYWEDCRENGYICVGWDEMGDLRQYDTRESARQKFNEVCGHLYDTNHPAVFTRKFKELWTLRELAPGDLVVAARGKTRVLAVGEVVEPGYEWREDRPKYRHVLRIKWDESYAKEIPTQSVWGFCTVAAVPQGLAAEILSKDHTPPPAVPVDRIYREMAEALSRKGQVILYGPPGTGKTYSARRFSVWWLRKQMGKEASAILSNPGDFAQAEQELSTTQVARRVWWVVANPKEWSWDRLFKDKRVTYHYGRIQDNYPLVRRGDLVIGYQSTPDKKLVALARISRELFTDGDGEPAIELEPVARINDGLTYEELQNDPVLSQSQPMRHRNQGTLFALTAGEFEQLSSLLTEREADLQKHLEGADAVGPLTRLTFHASYSYEDFIEGYRPADTNTGTLTLRLEDGVFKRVCRAAQANPHRPYLVLIDEINRANMAKVFGELITLLEKDKRGLSISLPQSKQSFTIPPNVYILGTMNTADRSIKLLDAALRRRFAFIELMPDPDLLIGGRVNGLSLSHFLEELNRRIAAKEGREKQIGHSFLLNGMDPISEPEEFAHRFRQEILPLLQEYCYDDYRLLADYIGRELVDEQAQTLNDDQLSDPEQLLAALEKEFSTSPLA